MPTPYKYTTEGCVLNGIKEGALIVIGLLTWAIAVTGTTGKKRKK